MFFSPFSIAIISLGEERAVCMPFVCLFVLHFLVCVSFLLVSGYWLRLVIEALPGLFFFTFVLYSYELAFIATRYSGLAFLRS